MQGSTKPAAVQRADALLYLWQACRDKPAAVFTIRPACPPRPAGQFCDAPDGTAAGAAAGPAGREAARRRRGAVLLRRPESPVRRQSLGHRWLAATGTSPLTGALSAAAESASGTPAEPVSAAAIAATAAALLPRRRAGARPRPTGSTAVTSVARSTPVTRLSARAFPRLAAGIRATTDSTAAAGLQRRRGGDCGLARRNLRAAPSRHHSRGHPSVDARLPSNHAFAWRWPPGGGTTRRPETPNCVDRPAAIEGGEYSRYTAVGMHPGTARGVQ